MKIIAFFLLTFCSIVSFAQDKVTADTTKSTQSIRHRDRPFRGLAIRNSFGNFVDPLYVVDGQVKTANELEEIDGNKIASISVLKDTAAENLYGEKAKNGVIVISMKQNSFTPTKN